MSRVIAHLGAHKTGTSLIQKYMRDKPEQIAPHGIVAISRSDTNTLIGWGHALLDSPNLLTERLHTEVAVPGTRFVVFSHENALGRPLRPAGAHLYPESGKRIAALAAILRSFDARVIFYLRSQASFLESYYLQLIQQGEWFSFETWLKGIDLSRVSWRPLVDRLRAEFSPDRVTIGDFEEIRRGQEEFLKGFFHHFDPAMDIHPEYGAQRNLSISERGLRIALAANPYLRTVEEKRAMRDFLQRHFSNAKYPRPVLFTDEQRAELDDRYRAEYHELVGGGGSTP